MTKKHCDLPQTAHNDHPMPDDRSLSLRYCDYMRAIHRASDRLWRLLAFTYAYACLNASRWSLRIGTEGAEDAEDIVLWFLKVARIIDVNCI